MTFSISVDCASLFSFSIILATFAELVLILSAHQQNISTYEDSNLFGRGYKRFKIKLVLTLITYTIDHLSLTALEHTF